jgi:tRNA(Ile)-lysidine synthase
MQFTTETLQQNLKKIEGFSFSKKTIICVSGGVDSMVLLHASSQILKNIIAVTVDHNYRKTSAAEAKFVAKFCKKINIPHFILTNKTLIPQNNIEENLRKIRYDLITEFAKKNKISQAILAHHRDDNIETFFMRLERGSGLQGLSCMQALNEINNIKFFRPLLDIPKSSLQAYLQKNKIKHVEDESNKNTKFTRNKLRKFLSEFSGDDVFSERVSQTIKALSEAQNIIKNIEDEAAKNLVKIDKKNAQAQINYQQFFYQPQAIALRILKNILIDINSQNKIPRYESLQMLYKNLQNNKSFKKQTLNGCFIELKKDFIIVSKEVKTLKKQ